jgi:hypothetical protein
MSSADDFRMQPAEVADATKQLDALAGRVEKLMATEVSNLTVTPAGRDEVSQRVAATLNEAHSQFAISTDKANNEMRETAATLRAHANDVVAAEHDFAI